MSTLYLLHFDPRFHHAGHYLGFSAFRGAKKRVAEHLAGHGSKLTKAAVAAGCALRLVACAEGDRCQERRIKRISRLWRWCPVCCARCNVAARKLDEQIRVAGPAYKTWAAQG